MGTPDRIKRVPVWEEYRKKHHSRLCTFSSVCVAPYPVQKKMEEELL
jgi:hypothetical protein